MSIVDLTFKISDKIIDDRTYDDIFRHTTEELGELATEISIVKGKSYKDAGVDGIVGESIDAIICLLDLIHKHDPDITEQDILDIAHQKLGKWEQKVHEQMSKKWI